MFRALGGLALFRLTARRLVRRRRVGAFRLRPVAFLRPVGFRLRPLAAAGFLRPVPLRRGGISHYPLCDHNITLFGPAMKRVMNNMLF